MKTILTICLCLFVASVTIGSLIRVSAVLSVRGDSGTPPATYPNGVTLSGGLVVGPDTILGGLATPPSGSQLYVFGRQSNSAGYASGLNNKSAPTTITVGASVFNYTNTQPVNIQVFLDANGATTAVTMNGGALFATLAGGDHTIILQPGDRIGVTYSIATPAMKYREF